MSFVHSGLDNDEDIKGLEREITDMQKNNTRMEAQMIKLRAEITCMENKMQQHEKENQAIEEKNTQITEYYSSVKSMLIKRLQDIPLPHSGEQLREDNFEAYINQLRSLCMENYTSENKLLFNAVKLALCDLRLV